MCMLVTSFARLICRRRKIMRVKINSHNKLGYFVNVFDVAQNVEQSRI
jgi:hypothetical protein